MVMIQVWPETLVPIEGGSVMVPSRGIVDTPDEDFATYIVSMKHARYYEDGAPDVPISTVSPQLDKLTANIGDVVKCSQGTWEGKSPLEFFYKWDVDGVDIPSAVTAQHTVTLSDAGKSLMCRVRAVDPNNEKLLVDCEAPCIVNMPEVKK
jgi:hypothetical protein